MAFYFLCWYLMCMFTFIAQVLQCAFCLQLQLLFENHCALASSFQRQKTGIWSALIIKILRSLRCIWFVKRSTLASSHFLFTIVAYSSEVHVLKHNSECIISSSEDTIFISKQYLQNCLEFFVLQLFRCPRPNVISEQIVGTGCICRASWQAPFSLSSSDCREPRVATASSNHSIHLVNVPPHSGSWLNVWVLLIISVISSSPWRRTEE